MTRENAVAAAFIGAIAAVLAMAAFRGIFGDQAANYAELLLLWRILYLSMAPRHGKGGRRHGL